MTNSKTCFVTFRVVRLAVWVFSFLYRLSLYESEDGYKTFYEKRSAAGSEYDSQKAQKIKFTHWHFSAKLVIYRYHGSLSQDRKETPMKQNIANRSNGFMVSPSFFL